MVTMLSMTFCLFVSLLGISFSFDVSKVVPLYKLRGTKSRYDCQTLSGGRRVCKKSLASATTTNQNMLLVLAIDRTSYGNLIPRVTWQGRSGGAGCSFIQILFATPGCETKKESGVAEYFRPNPSGGVGFYAYFVPYVIPTIATVVKINIPRVGQCGKRSASRSCYSSWFRTEGIIGKTTTPYCMKAIYYYPTRSGGTCRWTFCKNLEFGIRVYTDVNNLNKYVTVKVTGDYIYSCPYENTNKYFTN